MIVGVPSLVAVNKLSRADPFLGDEFPFRRDQPAVSGFDADLRCIRRDWEFGIFKDVFNFFEVPLFAFGIPLLVDAFDDGAEEIVVPKVIGCRFIDAFYYKTTIVGVERDKYKDLPLPVGNELGSILLQHLRRQRILSLHISP